MSTQQQNEPVRRHPLIICVWVERRVTLKVAALVRSHDSTLPSSSLLRYGTQTLSLSKIVPHLCSVTGDQNPQVRGEVCSLQNELIIDSLSIQILIDSVRLVIQTEHFFAHR